MGHGPSARLTVFAEMPHSAPVAPFFEGQAMNSRSDWIALAMMLSLVALRALAVLPGSDGATGRPDAAAELVLTD